MVWAAAIPLIAAGISAAGSIGGAYLSNKGQGKESKIQRQKRKLVDELLASLSGRGRFSDLYSSDPEVFQKSYVEPAQAMFRNQIAPQIQQQYIASGQQRGTGLDDQLLRAGVDLDQMLNQQRANFYENAQNRKANAIGSIFGVPPGQAKLSSGEALSQATGGYLASGAFADAVKGVASSAYGGSNMEGPVQKAQYQQPVRPGYAPDWREASGWELGNPNWGKY